jgi:hypothetical protein
MFSGATLLAIGDNIMQLLTEEARHITAQILVPCVHCAKEVKRVPSSSSSSSPSSVYLFTLRECQMAVATGDSMLKCPLYGGVIVPVNSLGPDLAMASLHSCRMEMSEIAFVEEIAEGLFARVYKGRYRG